MEHRVDPGGDGVAVLALEALEIAVVAVQRLVGDPVAGLGQCDRLLRQRALELEQRAERARRGLPHGRGAGEVTLLVHERGP